MKFTLSILALLAIAFLVGCSAKDTSNKSELNNKYGGIYIFNKKYYEEIQSRERERSELKDCYENKSKSECEQVVKKQITTNGYFLNRVWNNNKDKFMKKYNSSDENIVLDRYVSHIVNKKIYPIQTLSNGKKYYTDTANYSREYGKQPKVPEIYKERIRNLIGKENLDKIPGIGLGSFYSDEEGNITPITMYIQYSDKIKSYGFFGDEGRGFSLSRDRFEYYEVKNKFYMEDLEKR